MRRRVALTGRGNRPIVAEKMSSSPPAPERASPRRDRATALFIVLAVPLAAYAVFALPYRFPPTGNYVSPSLVFGFNNTVAIGGVLALIGAATVFRLWIGRAVRSTPVRWFSTGSGEPPPRIRRTVLGFMIAAHAALVALMWLVAKTSSTWRLDFEASHFLWRLHLMNLFDARPYVDFQHEYGPALLYGPLCLYRVLAPLGLTLEAAYYLSYLGASVLGLLALLALLDAAEISRPRKEVAFCLLAAAGLTPYMGLNGNLVRYLPPYLGVLLADRILRRGRGLVWPVVAISGLGLANVLISPEIGVAFGLGWIVYCGFAALTDRRRAIVGIAGLAVAAALAGLGVPRQSAGSVLSFSAGAANFPLVPAPHIVFYLVVLGLGVSRLAADGLSGRGRPRSLLLGLAAISVAMIPGALTRADPPHVLCFGLGATLFCFVQAALHTRRAFAAYAVAFALVFIGGVQLSNARAFYDLSLRAFRPAEIVALVRRQSVPELTDAQLARLDAYPPLGLPFCSYGADRRTMAHLWARSAIDPEYYCGTIGVYSEAQLARKLADTRRHRYLLMRKDWLRDIPRIDPCRRHVALIRRSFIYPGPPACRRDALEPDPALTRDILAHDHVVEEVGPYVVMRGTGAP